MESSQQVNIPVNIDDEIDEDDTSIEEIKASLTRALQEAVEGKRIPLSQMWEGIELPSQG